MTAHTAARALRSSGTPRPGRRTFAYSSKVLTRLGSTTSSYSGWKNAGLFRSAGKSLAPSDRDGVAPCVAVSHFPDLTRSRAENTFHGGGENGSTPTEEPSEPPRRLLEPRCRQSPSLAAIVSVGSRTFRSRSSASASVLLYVVRTMRAFGVLASEVPCPVEEHDRLASARSTGETERPVPGAFRVLALLGMEEDSPSGEVGILDGATEFLVVLDEGELEPSGWMVEGSGQRGVGVFGCARLCVADGKRLFDGLDTFGLR